MDNLLKMGTKEAINTEWGHKGIHYYWIGAQWGALLMHINFIHLSDSET